MRVAIGTQCAALLLVEKNTFPLNHSTGILNMGLFSKLRKSSASQDHTLAKAVLVPSVMVMLSDGSVDDSELIQMSNLCAFSPIFATVPPETAVALMKDIVNEFTSEGFQTVLDRTKAALPMPMRETALSFSMRISMADGRLDDNELKSLIILSETFEIPEAKFRSMFDVMVILQRAPQAA